jgi:hypothetical protein
MIMKKGHPCTEKGAKAEEGRGGRMMMMMKEEREKREEEKEKSEMFM